MVMMGIRALRFLLGFLQMDAKSLQALLQSVSKGTTTVNDAAAVLKDLPFADLGFANVDHHRALRQGLAEVVFGAGKAPEHVVAIVRELASKGTNVLVTRVTEPQRMALEAAAPRGLSFNALGRTAFVESAAIAPLPGTVALVSAGTSDAPVVAECAETLRAFGAATVQVMDVGVAGIHRLLAKRHVLASADVLIVVAGMEGALPSAVGGMVSAPVIAVPTSVGYGAAFGGVAALLGMLTSCASGVTVVNIDNGFGAAFAAARMLQLIEKGSAAHGT
jgi:pyridinium-3,5-biscarboxylic acid mononucleotide synthase